MNTFTLLVLYAISTALDWLCGLLCVLVIHPARGTAKAVWLALQWPVAEFRLWQCVGDTPEYRARLKKQLADFRQRWKWRKTVNEILAEDPAEVERLSRLRHPDLWRERD